ncbi:MAG: hypothetical protein ACYC4L_04625 [Chloroflexota bacterium]
MVGGSKTELQELYVKFSADISELKAGMDAGFKAIGAQTQKFSKETETAAQKLERSLTRLNSAGQKMTVFLTAPLLAAGAALAKFASDAIETENLFKVSMGNMAESASAWASELHDTLGLSQVDVKRTIGTFNVMFDSMKIGSQAAYEMSQGLTLLKYDMASFYNLSLEESFTKLSAGIMGETEPLRRLGIVLDETTVKSWALAQGLINEGQELTQAQKVLARYQILAEKTAKSQGDLARTINSPANQLRILSQQFEETSQKIGRRLLPALNSGFKGLSAALKDASKGWDGMGAAAQAAILSTAVMLAAGGPLLVGISNAIRAVYALRAAWLSMSVGAKFGIAGLVAAAVAIPTFAAAQAQIDSESYEDYLARKQYETQGIAEHKPLSREAWTAQRTEKGVEPPKYPEITDFEKEWQAAANEDTKSKISGVSDALKAAGISEGEYVDATVAGETASQKAAGAVDSLRGRLEALQDAQGGASGAMDAANDVLEKMRDRVSDLSDALSKAKQKLDDLTNPRLKGMGVYEDKIFALEQELRLLEIKRLQTEQSARGPADHRAVDVLEKQIATKRRELDLLRTQMEAEYAPQLRRIERVATPPAPEMTEDETVKRIKETKSEISKLESDLKTAKQAVEEQEDRIKELEQANKGLGGSLKDLQKDLQLAEEKQTAVNDALTKAYTWMMLDRDKVRELGGEAKRQADTFDVKTRELLTAINKYAEEETKEALDAIKKVTEEWEKARLKMAEALVPAKPIARNPADVTTGAGWTQTERRLGGGPITEPVIGVGQKTGKTWTFAEDGRTEWVTAADEMRASQRGVLAAAPLPLASGARAGDEGGDMIVNGPLVAISNVKVGSEQEARNFGATVGEEVDRYLSSRWRKRASQGGPWPYGQ